MFLGYRPPCMCGLEYPEQAHDILPKRTAAYRKTTELLHSQLVRKGRVQPFDTENIKKGRDAYEIDVLIIVERENLKKIIVGHQGDMIKKIGIESRKDIEKLMGKKVYLNLFVKTVNKWRDKDRYLTEFGYKNNE